MSTLLAILLNILVAAVLYILLNRKIDRQLSPKEMLDRIREEVEDIIRELNHTTDRNIGLIEDRIESLKSVLETADRRLSLLRREAEKHEMSSAVYTSILKKNRKAPPESSRESAAAEAARPAARDEESTAADEASEGGRTVAKGKTGGEEAGGRLRRPDFKAQVLDLYRKGISPSIIAGRVGSTLGEVELIISLSGERPAGGAASDGEGRS